MSMAPYSLMTDEGIVQDSGELQGGKEGLNYVPVEDMCQSDKMKLMSNQECLTQYQCDKGQVGDSNDFSFICTSSRTENRTRVSDNSIIVRLSDEVIFRLS